MARVFLGCIVLRTVAVCCMASFAASFSPVGALAATPAEVKALILQPTRDDLSDIGPAEREADRLGNAGIRRLEATMNLNAGVAGYIENVRQRVLERHARDRALHDLYLASFDALAHPDGRAPLPEFGPYAIAVVSRADLQRSIDEDRKRMAAELDLWARGEVTVGIPGFPDSSLRSVERDVAGWRQRIEEARQAMGRGEVRVVGRPWFFGSVERRELPRLRAEIERRLADTDARLSARPETVSLREVGFSSVADVDREIDNTRRTLNELESAFQRKDYRLERWGDTAYATDLENRIAGMRREQDEIRRNLDSGTMKVSFPESLSRRELEERITELRQRIANINKAVGDETYKVDVYGAGPADARALRDTIANSKDANLRSAAQAALQRLPATAQLHKRVYEVRILLFEQWIRAIPKLAEPAFVRRDFVIQQSTEFLAEFEPDLRLARARYERRLVWLDKCRQALGGAPLAGQASAQITPPPQTAPAPAPAPAASPSPPTVQPGAVAQRLFTNPSYPVRVDNCLNWGSGCGKPAADAFCRMNGLTSSQSFKTAPSRPTYVLGDRRTCDVDGCIGFTEIVCQ